MLQRIVRFGVVQLYTSSRRARLSAAFGKPMPYRPKEDRSPNLALPPNASAWDSSDSVMPLPSSETEISIGWTSLRFLVTLMSTVFAFAWIALSINSEIAAEVVRYPESRVARRKFVAEKMEEPVCSAVGRSRVASDPLEPP